MILSLPLYRLRSSARRRRAGSVAPHRRSPASSSRPRAVPAARGPGRDDAAVRARSVAAYGRPGYARPRAKMCRRNASGLRRRRRCRRRAAAPVRTRHRRTNGVRAPRSSSPVPACERSRGPDHDPGGMRDLGTREYTLFMDPPAIEAPVVAAAQSPRRAKCSACRRRSPPLARQDAPPRSQPRSARRATLRTGARSGAQAEAPAKARGAQRTRRDEGRRRGRRPPQRPPPGRDFRFRAALPARFTGALATEADRERARQERRERDRSRDAGAAPAHRRIDRDGRADAAGTARAGNGRAGRSGASRQSRGTSSRRPRKGRRHLRPARKHRMPPWRAVLRRKPRRRRHRIRRRRSKRGSDRRRCGECADGGCSQGGGSAQEGGAASGPSWWEQNALLIAAHHRPAARDRGRLSSGSVGAMRRRTNSGDTARRSALLDGRHRNCATLAPASPCAGRTDSPAMKQGNRQAPSPRATPSMHWRSRSSRT